VRPRRPGVGLAGAAGFPEQQLKGRCVIYDPIKAIVEEIAEAGAEVHVNLRYGHLSCAARQRKLAEAYDLIVASLFVLAERLPRMPEASLN
jgi:hypothetical protein